MDTQLELASKDAAAVQDNYGPVQREIEADNLVIRGELPRGLQGVLYRNGPNPRFPLPGLHWFGGDGMIHAIAVDNGQASYRNRWVRTPKWRDEDRAGRALFRTFAGKLPDAPPWAGKDGGVANTHIVPHAGKLLALEEGHLPTGIAPRTLDTLGYIDFGLPAGPFTAHPKTDPDTGEMVFFGYNATGMLSTGVRVGAIDGSGALRYAQDLQAPYSSMIHDFIVTQRHIVLPVLPLTGSLARARQGGPAYAWEPDKATMLGVVRRGDPQAPVRWFEGPPCYVFHVMNAWETEGRLHADVMMYDEAPLFPHADGSAGDPARQQAYLTRWTLDLNSSGSGFEIERLDAAVGEFPRIDERRNGLPYRHGWFAAADDDGSGELASIVHVDLSNGTRNRYVFPNGGIPSEPVFAARGPDEGEGWILAVVWQPETGSSEMQVFEACDIASGPLAAIELPQRVPFGFHGSWVPA